MKKHFTIFGHRGARGYYPENTIGSIALALEQGLNWVEFDIYNVENQLVLFHDYTLGRTTNGQGCIANVDLKYLRSLDAGQGEKIPLLTEVLDTFVGKLNYNIELKGANTAEILNKLLDQYISQGKYTLENFIISSFNHPELTKVSDKYKKGALYSVIPLDNNDFVSDLNPYSVHVDSYCINQQLVADAHQKGYKVYTYTVNDEHMLKKVLDCNVDGIFTDYPDRLIGLLRGKFNLELG